MKIIWKESKAFYGKQELVMFELDLAHRVVLQVQQTATTNHDLCFQWELCTRTQSHPNSYNDPFICQTLRETDPERVKEEALQEARKFLRQCLERVGG